MRYILFNGEKSIQDLAARVFQVSGRKQSKAITQAVDALLKANPHLSDLSSVPVGTPITVPDNAPPFALNDAGVSTLTRTSAVERLQAAMDTLDARLAEIQAEAAEHSKLAIDLLRSKPIQQAAKAPPDDPVLTKLFPNVQTAAKDLDSQLSASDAVEAERKKLFAERKKAASTFASSNR